MAGIKGGNQGLQITQRYLNTATYAGDPTPGAVVSTSQVSGSIVQSYAGQYGGIITLSQADANYFSDPNYQQLYAGDYMYVHFDPNMKVAAAVQGQIVFWSGQTTGNLLGTYDRVSADFDTAGGIGTNSAFPVAGIALENTAAGNFWFIQTAGVAQVKFSGSLGPTSPAVGDLIFCDYNSQTSFAYDPVQSGNPTYEILKQLLGQAWLTAPKASTISPVFLGQGPKYYPGQGGGGGQ